MKLRNRGFYGVGIYSPKMLGNIGTLWRTAHCFGADFIFTIGKRYKGDVTDTTKASKHIPLFEFDSLEDFESHKPKDCETVCIEITPNAVDLTQTYHPERAAYILGAEDYGLPEDYMKNKKVVQIGNLNFCLNVSVAGSLVMYDRALKSKRYSSL